MGHTGGVRVAVAGGRPHTATAGEQFDGMGEAQRGIGIGAAAGAHGRRRRQGLDVDVDRHRREVEVEAAVAGDVDVRDAGVESVAAPGHVAWGIQAGRHDRQRPPPRRNADGVRPVRRDRAVVQAVVTDQLDESARNRPIAVPHRPAHGDGAPLRDRDGGAGRRRDHGAGPNEG